MNLSSSGSEPLVHREHAASESVGIVPVDLDRPSLGKLAPQNIALFGPPGVGKTVIGKLLAETLNRPLVDTDTEIEAISGKTIEAIFRDEGEAAFRDLERELSVSLARRTGLVVACGGGTLLDDVSRQAFEASSSVVFLDCAADTLLTRLDRKHDRPLLTDDLRTKLAALLAERAQVYLSFETRLDTTGRGPSETVAEIQAVLRAVQVRRWTVNQPPADYTVQLGPGLLERLTSTLASHGLHPPYIVISDSHVGPLYAEDVCRAIDGRLVTFPAGEQSKTLATVEGLSERCLNAGLERGGTVIALGGGVVGDVAGFVSAVYMRGVRWAALPTSLLAMIDASVGGKVGVDLTSGKNLIGAFYPPGLVLADTRTLETLPDEEFRAGMAELVKASLVGDPTLFDWLEAGDARPSPRWLERSLTVKLAIVERDLYEQGERADLNLGHTVGHALERLSDYTLRHGEAIAIGLVAETRMAERLGLAEAGLARRIETVLSRLKLPVRIQNGTPGQVRLAMTADKKRVGNAPRFALPISPGKVKTGCLVPDHFVLEVLEEMVR